MTLKALIIDDEPLAHDIIQQYVDDIQAVEIVGRFHLATEALAYLSEHQVDLLFLDIQMPKLKGNEFLRILPNKPFVIITSAYEEYALESFELDVIDYLLKPFRFDRFLKAIHKVVELHQLKQEKPKDIAKTNSKGNKPKQLFIKVDKKQVQLDLAEVFYLESYGNYVKVWLEEQCLLTPRTLSSFEEQFEGTSFMRVHKSFIVEKSHIAYIEGNRISLSNGVEIPIGKHYKGQIAEL